MPRLLLIDDEPNVLFSISQVFEPKQVEGTNRPEDPGLKTDVRVLAATNQNLESLIEQGRFRKDL